jgi:hypothetical protein
LTIYFFVYCFIDNTLRKSCLQSFSQIPLFPFSFEVKVGSPYCSWQSHQSPSLCGPIQWPFFCLLAAVDIVDYCLIFNSLFLSPVLGIESSTLVASQATTLQLSYITRCSFNSCLIFVLKPSLFWLSSVHPSCFLSTAFGSSSFVFCSFWTEEGSMA